MSETNQAYINRVHLKGYKSIRDLEIDLKPGLNIIIGPNGSGKTNFLEFFNLGLEYEYTNLKGNNFELNYYAEVKEGRIYYYVRGFNALSIAKKNNEFNFEEIVEFNSQKLYRRIFTLIKNKALKKLEEGDEDIAIENALRYFFVQFLKFGVPNNFNYNLGSTIYVRKNLSKQHFDYEYSLAIKSNESQQSVAFIFKNIENNIKYKKNVNTKNIREFITPTEEFTQILSQYSPISAIRVDMTSLRIYKNDENDIVLDNIIIQFNINNHWYYWDSLSDGTKRIFYLIESIMSYEHHYGSRITILLEEPELGIHPDQLYKLMDFLKEQSKEKQIIITTHSPEVLNILGKDELDHIIVTRYDDEKGTQMHKLSPTQIKKGQTYMEKVGHLSDYWVHSNLEEYEIEE